MLVGLIVAGCASSISAQECLVAPKENTIPSPVTTGDANGLPSELTSLSTSLLFEDSFDNAPDFANPDAVSNCVNGNPADNCALLPSGWTDYLTSEWWHPSELGSSSKASLQINASQGRGGSGKSLQIWDESRGSTGSWGSDAMLGKKLTPGYTDLYVEFWIKFQPEYRWHHADLSNTHGINYAKILRIGHRDEGLSPFSFSGSGFSAPITFIDAQIWFRDSSGSRNNRAGVSGSIRCDPQESNYKCPGYGGVPAGYIDNESFAETFGDGGWHKIAARMALNSAPGATDGILQLWFDNRLVTNATDIPFLSSTAPASHLLNSILLGGNMHNYPEPESKQYEQWYAIDDVKIYTVN